MGQTLDNETLQRLVSAAVSAVLAELKAESSPVSRRVVPVLVSPTIVGLDFAAAALHSVATLPLTFEWWVAGPDVSRVEQLVPQGKVRSIADAPLASTLAEQAYAVVAATLDRSTAMRVSLTMPETFGSELLLGALNLGKPVVVATDGLGLEQPLASPQLRAALAEPIGRLEAFGAECVASQDLGKRLKAVLSGPDGLHPRPNRPLVTASDVEAAGDELVVPPEAVVTPLAVDRARELGVALRRPPN